MLPIGRRHVPRCRFNQVIFSAVDYGVVGALVRDLRFKIYVASPNGYCYYETHAVLCQVLGVRSLVHVSRVSERVKDELPGAMLPIVPTVIIVGGCARLAYVLPALPGDRREGLLPYEISSRERRAVCRFFIGLFCPSFAYPVQVFLTVANVGELFGECSIDGNRVFLAVPIDVFVDQVRTNPLRVCGGSILFFCSTRLFVRSGGQVTLCRLGENPVLNSSLRAMGCRALNGRLSALFCKDLCKRCFLVAKMRPIAAKDSFSL